LLNNSGKNSNKLAIQRRFEFICFFATIIEKQFLMLFSLKGRIDLPLFTREKQGGIQ
jgi:hypothetical protein